MEIGLEGNNLPPDTAEARKELNKARKQAHKDDLARYKRGLTYHAWPGNLKLADMLQKLGQPEDLSRLDFVNRAYSKDWGCAVQE